MSTLQVLSSNGNLDTPNGNHLSPTANGVRRISGGYSPSRTVDTMNSNGIIQLPPSSPHSTTPENVQWSSAVGHATTAGKSGRVIEKLMADNDRLKRELKEHQIKAEELQRSMQMFKPQIEALQAENDNLSHARGVDQSLLTRRDRQIKDLKGDLGVEKERRQSLEQRVIQLQMERDEAVNTKDRDIQTYKEQAKQAENHGVILETGLRQLRAEYQTRMDRAQSDFFQLKEARQRDAERLARLDIVSNQMRQENERIKKQQEQTMTLWKDLQDVSRQRIQAVERETKAERERTMELGDKMDEVVKEMRWVMGIKKNTGLDKVDI